MFAKILACMASHTRLRRIAESHSKPTENIFHNPSEENTKTDQFKLLIGNPSDHIIVQLRCFTTSIISRPLHQVTPILYAS